MERILKAGFGLFFLVTSAAFILSGFTVFPFFGFLLAIPVFFLSLYFFSVHMGKNCEIGAQ